MAAFAGGEAHGAAACLFNDGAAQRGLDLEAGGEGLAEALVQRLAVGDDAGLRERGDLLGQLQRGRKRGPCRAVLWVLEQNERARRFYDSDGWQADGAMQEDDSGGRKLMALRYALSL